MLLTPAEQEAVILAHWKLPYSVYYSLTAHPAVRRLGPDDAHSEGLVAMVTAARVYDPEKGTMPFGDFAWMPIRYRILAAALHFLPLAVPYYRRGNAPIPVRVGLDGREPWVVCEDELVAAEERAERNAAAGRLRDMVAELSEQDRIALVLRVHGATLAEIAETLGLASRQRAEQIKVRALKRLRGKAG